MKILIYASFKDCVLETHAVTESQVKKSFCGDLKEFKAKADWYIAQLDEIANHHGDYSSRDWDSYFTLCLRNGEETGMPVDEMTKAKEILDRVFGTSVVYGIYDTFTIQEIPLDGAEV